MSKQAIAKKKTSRGPRSGRHSTREVYRSQIRKAETATPPGSNAHLRILPPILKDQRGMATDYSCRLAKGSIARVKLERRAATHYWIDWVFVPPGFRDYGTGRRMMQEVVADADAQGVRLSLEARACAGLDQAKLEAWYGSFGFTKTPFRGEFGPILVRTAQSTKLSTQRAA